MLAEVKRVAIGMSGGLDSSVVAALMVEQGYDVIGLTLHLFKEGARCCSLEDVQRSQRVCEKIGIKHFTLNAVDLFEDAIIKPFVEEYSRGRTPNPCVLCNQHIKFGILMKRAEQLGCSHMATGHYVRIEERDGLCHLFKGRDAKKDQSYFLHRLTQEQLSKCIFPLESWRKTKVAAYAEEKELPVSISSKEESQDLCFVSDDGYAAVVEKFRPELKKKGVVKNPAGKPLGYHDGYYRYTIGQRKGLGIAAPQPMYVKSLNPEENEVTLAPREEVQRTVFTAEEIHWVAEPVTEDRTCLVRIRYQHKGMNAKVVVLSEDSVEVIFPEPQFAITSGQAAVFYDGDEVLGGGWIK